MTVGTGSGVQQDGYNGHSSPHSAHSIVKVAVGVVRFHVILGLGHPVACLGIVTVPLAVDRFQLQQPSSSTSVIVATCNAHEQSSLNVAWNLLPSQHAFWTSVQPSSV
mgnify:CR=1 FL=1